MTNAPVDVKNVMINIFYFRGKNAKEKKKP